MTPRLRPTLALAALTAVLLGVPAATAYRLGGAPWPGGVVRYHNAVPDQAWAVQKAAAEWNASGAKVRFVAVSRARAALVIERLPASSGRSCADHASATLGRVRNARVRISPFHPTDPACNPFWIVRAMTHELGHVLGLEHESRGCAAMNPSGSYGGSARCPRLARWEWRCRLLEADDVAGAVRRYGGSARPVRAQQGCALYAAVRAPTHLSASVDAAGTVRLRFRRPPSPQIPGFLLADGAVAEGFAYARSRGVCRTAFPAAAARHGWRAGRADLGDRPGPGRWCYAVWALDALGRPSAAPALARVDVAA